MSVRFVILNMGACCAFVNPCCAFYLPIVRLCVFAYVGIMKILYTYERPFDDGSDIPVDKVFADTKDMRRVERTALLDKGGLQSGDTLYLRSPGQLGHGAEAALMQAKAEALGANVTLALLPEPPRRDPAVHWRPSDVVKERCLVLWYSALPTRQVLARVIDPDIAGRPVSRDQMYRLGGPRDGSKKPKD